MSVVASRLGSVNQGPSPSRQAKKPSQAVRLLDRAINQLGGSRRPGQQQMAQAVEQALDHGQHLLVQAGTGVGKSLAYLIPALAHSVKTEQPVVVATATLALQRQIMEKDLPLALKATKDQLRRKPSAALLMGRANYLCRAKLEGDYSAEEEPLFDLEQSGGAGRSKGLAAEVRALYRWSGKTKTGQREDVPGGTSPAAWRQVSVSAVECTGPKCRFHGNCFAERARGLANNADLVVTNHALVALSLAGQAALPEHGVVVIDEAHQLAASLTNAYTSELSAAQVWRASKALDRLEVATDSFDRAAAALEAALNQTATGWFRSGLPQELTQALAALGSEVRAATSAVGKADATEAVLQQTKAELDQILAACDRMTGTDRGLPETAGLDPASIDLTTQDSVGPIPGPSGAGSPGSDAVGTTSAGPDEPGSESPRPDTVGTAPPGPDEPGSGSPRPDTVSTAPPGPDEPGSGSPGPDAPGPDTVGNAPLGPAPANSTAQDAALPNPAGTTSPRGLAGASVTWCTRPLRGSLEGDPVLYAAPLEVASLLRWRLLDQVTTVMTSATLAVGGSFRVPAATAGLAGNEDGKFWRGLAVDSPFDYQHQAILYLASHLPAPDREGRAGTAQQELMARLIEASGGGALGLFSSQKAAERAAQVVAGKVDYPVLCQGERSLGALVDQFLDEPDTCLFGTLSLWQGLDAPGRTCRLVMIDRLPFPRPDDPLYQARTQAANQAGRSGFMEVAASHAATLLAQGVGRLIRQSTDRGVVAVLDSRLATARYGGFMLAGLPPMWRTEQLDQVLASLGHLATEH